MEKFHLKWANLLVCLCECLSLYRVYLWIVPLHNIYYFKLFQFIFLFCLLPYFCRLFNFSFALFTTGFFVFSFNYLKLIHFLYIIFPFLYFSKRLFHFQLFLFFPFYFWNNKNCRFSFSFAHKNQTKRLLFFLLFWFSLFCFRRRKLLRIFVFAKRKIVCVVIMTMTVLGGNSFYFFYFKINCFILLRVTAAKEFRLTIFSCCLSFKHFVRSQ